MKELPAEDQAEKPQELMEHEKEEEEEDQTHGVFEEEEEEEEEEDADEDKDLLQLDDLASKKKRRPQASRKSSKAIPKVALPCGPLSLKTPSALWKTSGFIRLIPSILLCLSIWFIPPPAGLSAASIHLLAVFLAVIFSFLTQPYPMSVTVLLGLIVLSLSRSFQCELHSGEGSVPCDQCGKPIPAAETSGEPAVYDCQGLKGAFEVALEGFSHTTVWLVFAAFQIGFAVETTGLGKRLSLLLIKYLGRSLVGLGYSVCLSEMLLGPLIPSNTARGSVVMAIVASICRTIGSTAETNPVNGGGQYLMLVGSHANLIAASMYQTGMAANPILSIKAKEVFGVDWQFGHWIMGSWAPALTAFILLPLYMRVLSKATVDISTIRAHVGKELTLLGPLKAKEKVLMLILLGCLGLWISTTFTGLDSTLVALLGVVSLLLTGTVEWDEMLKNQDAWDTTVWLGGLVLMADQLAALGITRWIGNGVAAMLTDFSPLAAAISLSLVYFYSMYLFCSLTGHIVAFSGPFLEAGKALGVPPYLLLPLISYFSTLCGCLTNYSSGPVVLYFGQKFCSVKKWFVLGFLVSLMHLAVWFTVGMGWWKILGWY